MVVKASILGAAGNGKTFLPLTKPNYAYVRVLGSLLALAGWLFGHVWRTRRRKDTLLCARARGGQKEGDPRRRPRLFWRANDSAAEVTVELPLEEEEELKEKIAHTRVHFSMKRE